MDANRATTDDLTGALLARRYRVVRRVGQGLVGTVYLCDCLLDEEQVAVKVLHPELARATRTAARFPGEVQNAARLRHANVVRIRDSGEDVQHQLLYIAADYIEGRNLDTLIAEEWPLTDARMVQIMTQILTALSAAHTLGIVHRDLKPNNVLVRAHGASDRVSVCDFGIAQLAPARLTGAAGRRLGSLGANVIGSPEYGSPEHARGETLDARSDIYSAGVLLFQMLTRTLPFVAETPLDVALQHCGTPPPPPSGFGYVNAAIEAACLKALSKTREARFQTAQDMQSALSAALGEVTVSRTTPLRPRGPARTTGKPRRSRIPTQRLTVDLNRQSAVPLQWHGTFETHGTRRLPQHQHASLSPGERVVRIERGTTSSKQVPALMLVAGMAVAGIAWGLAVHSLSRESDRAGHRQDDDVNVPPRATTSALASRALNAATAPGKTAAPPAQTPISAAPPRTSDLPARTAVFDPRTVQRALLDRQATSILGSQPTAAAAPSAPAQAATPASAEAKVVIGAAFTTSAVPNANLRQAIDERGLNECYRQAQGEADAPAEPLEVRLDVETDQVGHITTASLHGAELPKALRGCVLQVARSGQVDVQTHGHILGSVPLTFQPR